MSYNITDGGEGMCGVKMTDENKEKLRLRMTGENNPFYGKTFDKETLEHLSEVRKGRTPWNKGKMMSDEYCKKNSEAHIGLQSGDKNGMFGKHHSDSAKEKIKRPDQKRYISMT